MTQGIAQLPAAQGMGRQMPQQAPQQMPQQMAPGQAPMPQVLPQQQPITPQAVTDQLENLPPQVLQAMWGDPANWTPKWAVMTAYAKAIENQRKLERAKGQQAMAQNQQMQAQPSVAQQIMSQPVMQAPTQYARHGGMMRGYAGGGAVAFQLGGDTGFDAVDTFTDSAEFPQAYGGPSEPSPRRLEQEREAKIAALQQQIEFLERAGSEATRAQAAQKRQELEALMRGAPSAPPAATTPPLAPYPETAGMRFPASIVRQGIGALGQPPRSSAQARPAAAVATPQQTPMAATPAELPPEYVKAIADREALLRGRLARPESLVKAEEGLAALAQSNIQAQRAEAQRAEQEARAQQEAAMGRARGNLAREALQVAAGIDTRKGAGMGSLFGGVSKVLEQRAAGEEAARKEFGQAQRDIRAMQANIRQTEMLEAQRKVALERGKLDEVNQINDQLATLAADREKFRITRGDTAYQQALEGRKVAAQERQARAAEISAGKPSEFEIFMRNPEAFKQFLEAKTGARNDVAELRAFISSLRDQVDPMKNFDAASRQQASIMLKQAQDKLAQMAGLQTTGVAPTGGAARPTSQAEFDALPKGARFINPADGKEYVKN